MKLKIRAAVVFGTIVCALPLWISTSATAAAADGGCRLYVGTETATFDSRDVNRIHHGQRRDFRRYGVHPDRVRRVGQIFGRAPGPGSGRRRPGHFRPRRAAIGRHVCGGGQSGRSRVQRRLRRCGRRHPAGRGARCVRGVHITGRCRSLPALTPGFEKPGSCGARAPPAATSRSWQSTLLQVWSSCFPTVSAQLWSARPMFTVERPSASRDDTHHARRSTGLQGSRRSLLRWRRPDSVSRRSSSRESTACAPACTRPA